MVETHKSTCITCSLSDVFLAFGTRTGPRSHIHETKRVECNRSRLLFEDQTIDGVSYMDELCCTIIIAVNGMTLISLDFDLPRSSERLKFH